LSKAQEIARLDPENRWIWWSSVELGAIHFHNPTRSLREVPHHHLQITGHTFRYTNHCWWVVTPWCIYICILYIYIHMYT
jgi:hypothetical protein